MMDNPFDNNPFDDREDMIRAMEDEERYEAEKYEDAKFKDAWLSDTDEQAIDRNGVPIKIGDQVKLVGRGSDSTIHFAPEMNHYLRSEEIFIVRAIKDFRPYPVFKLQGAADWSWSHKNVEKVIIKPPKKAEPVTFDPSLLDI